jgi:hypothetical protein
MMRPTTTPSASTIPLAPDALSRIAALEERVAVLERQIAVTQTVTCESARS